MGSGVKSSIFAALALALVAGVLGGCSGGSENVNSSEIRKEIEPPKNPDQDFSSKMEKYKIGGPNSPPGMQGKDGAPAPELKTIPKRGQ